jgi:hypothetical protein
LSGRTDLVRAIWPKPTRDMASLIAKGQASMLFRR